ncbi:unnamed protein product [Ranitomeya imitator]|uniref:Thrombospondin-like N-terminal domain-containing protein n=1 Tax=Ranitomeya imitator TaxID=111125 RepID=A0ABN9KWU3_9NEOB|nr:unnamed protein product [Ranitomeya imitator]
MPVSSADSRVADWAVEARDIWDRTQDAIRASKERMRSSTDVHRRPAPTFAPGDLVWLSARNIRLRVESTKFAPRYLGPFKVLEQVNPVVYRLALPPRLGITDTFHVSLLKPVYMSWFSESSAGTSGSSTDDYEVNAILGCKVVRGKKFYLVDWKGYGPEDRLVFSSGLPEEYSITALFRVRRSTKKERWVLWKTLTHRGSPQEAILIDGEKKIVEFTAKQGGTTLHYTFKSRELHHLFDRQWHKLGICVQHSIISLYVDCKLIERRQTSTKDPIDFQGSSLIAGRASDDKPVDTQFGIICQSFDKGRMSASKMRSYNMPVHF